MSFLTGYTVNNILKKSGYNALIIFIIVVVYSLIGYKILRARTKSTRIKGKD